MGFQFGALQNLHGFSFVNLFFGLVSDCSILCSGSSFISFCRFEIRASGILFFRFFLSYVFCLIISIVFFSSSFFSLINLSRSFVSVIAVINFEFSESSAVIPSNTFFFYFYQYSPEVFRCFGFSLSFPEEFPAVVVGVPFW